MISLGNNEALKTLTKTLTFVDANANAGGSTIALPERCSGELKTIYTSAYKYAMGINMHTDQWSVPQCHPVKFIFIAADKVLFFPTQNIDIFHISLRKGVPSLNKKHLAKALLMSTLNRSPAEPGYVLPLQCSLRSRF